MLAARALGAATSCAPSTSGRSASASSWLGSSGARRVSVSRRVSLAVQQRGLHVVAAAAADDAGYGAAYEGLFRSKVFQSELVAREFDDIMNQLRSLAMMANRFPEFDMSGKEMFLERMEEQSERYKLFMKRLELCDDPAAKEYLRYTTAQMMNGGFDYRLMFEGLTKSLGQWRGWLDEERRVSSDPVKHQKFLETFRRAWADSMLGSLDLSALYKAVDPAAFTAAQRHPDFYKMVKDISTDPSSIPRWAEHPVMGPMVRGMWRVLQERGSAGGST